MQCRVCGTEEGNVDYRAKKRQSLCDACNRETPNKIGRDEFSRRYWGAGYETVPPGTLREFYSDYLASMHNFNDYRRATTCDAQGRGPGHIGRGVDTAQDM